MNAPVVPGRLQGLGHRLSIARALAAARGGDEAPGIAAALRATALGRDSTTEREWISRVERRRAALPGEAAALGRNGGAPAERAVADAAAIFATMSIPPAYGRLLFHLARQLRPERCFELGTGLGVSGSYLAAGLELNGGGTLLTADTEPHGGLAATGFERLGLAGRAETFVGTPPAITAHAAERGPFELAFLDADHSRDATVEAFEGLLPSLADGAVVAIDDIGWDAGMREAWGAIRAHPRVSSALSATRLGIVTAAAGRPA